MSFLYEKTPAALEELFKGALINNTFNAKDLIGTLKMSVESSFSYLYRLQRNMVRFYEVSYSTRRKDLQMTRDQIDKELKRLDKEIEDLLEEHPTDFETKVRKCIADKDALVKIQFGDYYMDERYRVCMSTDFDLTSSGTREGYRTGWYWEKELTLEDIITNPDIFRYIPIVTIDGLTYFDLKFKIKIGGEIIIITPFPETFMRGTDYKQIPHHTHIVFIDNLGLCTTYSTPVALRYYAKDLSLLPIDVLLEKKLPPKHIDGTYFAFLKFKFNKGEDDYYYPYQECIREGNFFRLNYDKEVLNIIKTSASIEFKIIFFHYMKKYTPYYGDTILVDRGKIPLCVIQEDENKPYKMPIPQDNIFVLKSNQGGRFKPDMGVGVEMYYPNIYKLYDEGIHELNKYQLYYFYQPEYILGYTPLQDFFYNYVKSLPDINYPIEEIINRLFYGDDLDDIITDDKILDRDRFMEVFHWVLRYYEKDMEYGIHDFILRETWTTDPLNYQTERMKQLVMQRYSVLQDYAHINRTIGNIHHLFVNTVDLKKRFRRSTFASFEQGESFFTRYDIVPKGREGSLLVVSDDTEPFDPDTMIFIRDFFWFDTRPNIGDYVVLENDEPRYIFMMKQRPDKEPKDLRVFIDGVYVWDYKSYARHDSNFIYLPVDKVKEDSYILIEEMDQYSYLTEIEFEDLKDEKVIHMVHSEELTPYATDLYILDNEGLEVPNEDYTITPIINDTEYSIQDDDGNNRMVHAAIFDVKLQLKKESLLKQPLEVRACKRMERYRFIMWRKAWPRFTMHGVKSNRQLSHIQIWHNGLLVPDNMYRVENFIMFKIYRIQMLKEFNIGDELVIEFSPYTHRKIAEFEEIPTDDLFIHLEDYINKPISLDYYDLYVNGKRLGLPHVFQIGQTGLLLKNLKSSHKLEIFEKERDDEYFGFIHGDEKYYYSILDLLGDSYITEEDRETIIREMIDNQLDERVESLGDNEDVEDYIDHIRLPKIEENSKIFYYEDLLPKNFINPDLLQFDKSYFIVEYPELANMFCVDDEGVSKVEGNVIFLNPDINIDTDFEHMQVMLFGENEIND